MNELRPERGMRLAHGGVPLAAALILSGCGGGAAPAAPPAPQPQPADAQAAPTVEDVQTDTAGHRPTFGLRIDFDTVEAGAFDQGKMWTFEFPPVEYFDDTYGLSLDEAWFERARLGALRIPSCSASFVSPNGLVLTNHHCAREFVTQVQQPGESLLDRGFYATDLADEREVEDFEADQLVEIVDVTNEVNTRLDAVAPEGRSQAREEVLSEIQERLLEERGGEDSGFVVEMVSLYNGGRTSAYVLRRYTSARLVMAPELQIGFFGGDPDNFTYPRYNLDFAFFRMTEEDGTPLASEHYFPVDDEGLEEGDPIFIVGNPGSTSRLQTVAQLEFRRDVSDRAVLELLRSRMAVLDAYIRAHPDVAEERDLRNEYFSLSNSEKAYEGQLSGLADPVIIARRMDTERDFRQAIQEDAMLAEEYGGLISEMAALQRTKRQQAPGFGAFLAMTSASIASGTLHRALVAFQYLNASQGGAPQDMVDGLMEEFEAIPDQPDELDRALMVRRFQDFVDYYGEESELASSVLGGSTPEAVAERVQSESVLSDSAQAVDALGSGALTMEDPAIGIVRSYLPAFIRFQQVIAEVFPQEEEIAAQLGRARFEIYGTGVPPDATFSLRIADGTVTGYEYNGTVAPPFTTFYGLYDRRFSHDEVDWALPDRWLGPPAGLDLSAELNFISTADIIGGNSGSPVLDAELEVVGVVFDGNIESLPGDYIYLPEKNRAVAVDIRGVLEALDAVYEMDRLVIELTSGTLPSSEEDADRPGTGGR